jgi:acetyl esterase/lipase
LHLAATARDLGLNPDRIAVAGDSAGGALAAAASQGVASRGLNLKAQLLICPILDLAGESASRRRFAHGYLVEKDAFEEDICAYVRTGLDWYDPRLSPLHAPDLKNTPPTLVHLAPYDPFHDEGLAYVERLKAAGADARETVHAGMIHYFAALGGAIPAARAATDLMGTELGALLRR